MEENFKIAAADSIIYRVRISLSLRNMQRAVMIKRISGNIREHRVDRLGQVLRGKAHLRSPDARAYVNPVVQQGRLVYKCWILLFSSPQESIHP